jgi:hypothetical protein
MENSILEDSGRWKSNVLMDLGKQVSRMGIWLRWLGIGFSGGLGVSGDEFCFCCQRVS